MNIVDVNIKFQEEVNISLVEENVRDNSYYVIDNVTEAVKHFTWNLPREPKQRLCLENLQQTIIIKLNTKHAHNILFNIFI